VFLSHTSELRNFPQGGSFVAAAERAVSACGHVIVDMADFPAADQPAAELCRERVQSCTVYVGIFGTRYGMPVRDQPQVSYTELEFDTATEARLDRLVFLLDIEAAEVGIPLSRLIDLEFGARQEAFRRRVQDSGLVTQSFTDPATLGQLVERSLRELTEKRRRRDGETTHGQDSAVVVAGEIPQEPLGFQPRGDLLAALATAGPGVRVVHALTGMRGVGKTHLAAAYARSRVAEEWRLVAWVNAENIGSMLAGLVETAAALDLGEGTGDGQVAGRAVRRWLEAGRDRCLLVFDNATDPAQLRPYIPAAGAAQVIITSNQQSMTYLGTAVPVDVFTEPEALTFLAARTGRADAAQARALAEELDFLPLALAQAAAVIAAQHLSYGTYLERLRRLPVSELLAPVEGGEYPRGVAAVVLLSLDAIGAGESGACGTVMDLLAVLSPAGVPRSLLHAAGEQGFAGREGPVASLPVEVVDRALARLAGASLLTFSLDGSSVAAHRLVMRVIRENLAASNALLPVCQAATELLQGLVQPLDERWHQDRAATRDLVEQILALVGAAATCPADDTLDRRMSMLKLWAVSLLNRLGDSTTQAIQIGELLVPDQERLQGPDHPDTLSARNNLAVAYRDAGRADEAITLDEQNLANRERVLGPDHPHTLGARNNLAASYQDAGRTDEAITLYEQNLANYERLQGPDHPDTLTARNNLAAAYQDAGRADEAITLYEQNLADLERVLGPDHPHTLGARNNLAAAYQDAGRTDEAISLHEQNLADRERLLGPDHPNTLNSRINLATAYQDAGRLNEAEALQRRAKRHPD
jgi:tetratricopeptide (TPR) repeat protein